MLSSSSLVMRQAETFVTSRDERPWPKRSSKRSRFDSCSAYQSSPLASKVWWPSWWTNDSWVMSRRCPEAAIRRHRSSSSYPPMP